VGQRGHCMCRGLYFFIGKELKIIKWVQDFLCTRIVSVIKSIEFVSDGMSYTGCFTTLGNNCRR